MKTSQLSRTSCVLLALFNLLLLAGCPPLVSGWIRTYGGTHSDYGKDLTQTFEGGYAVAGTTYSYGTTNGDLYLLKVTSNGNQSWYYTYGGFEFEKGYRIAQADDGGIVVAGTTTSFGAGELDACLLKVDGAGAYQWFRTYGTADDETVLGLGKTKDGGYILVGTSINIQSGNQDIYLVKTDADGVADWTRGIDYGGEEIGVGVVQAADGGYAITGQRILVDPLADSPPGYTATMCLVKTDENGIASWIEEFGENAAGFDICLSGDGGYVMAGAASGSALDPLDEDDGFAVRTDGDGNEVWSFLYDRPAQTCWLLSVMPCSGGGFIFSGDEGDAALMLKTDENGVDEWSRRFGESRGTRASGAAIIESSWGGYCLAGSQYDSDSDDWSVYMVKTDEDGNTGLPLTLP
ncbi:MAG: hypothetical protein K1Y02_11880 [Candidatus Hydrogenedentes bacterium]|nr:hypothetical protein [Candidatus Hydrogenedentota bacterium]